MANVDGLGFLRRTVRLPKERLQSERGRSHAGASRMQRDHSLRR